LDFYFERNVNICLRQCKLEQERDIQKVSSINRKLIKTCPSFASIETDNLSLFLLNELFPDGRTDFVYLRNTSTSNERITFALRVIRYDDDILEDYLSDNQTLLIAGHKFNGICYVDDFNIVQDTEKLSYESEESFYFSDRPLPNDNTFIECIGNLESVSLVLSENLQNWKSYLKWKRELASKQLHGAKYYNFHYDSKKNLLVFNLIYPNKETFDKEKRYLKRDACVFNNRVSLDMWNFSYDRQLKYIENFDIGSFQGYSSESVFNGNAEVNVKNIHSHPKSKQEDKEIESTSGKKYSEKDLKERFNSVYLVDVSFKLPEEVLEKMEKSEKSGKKDDEDILDDYLSDIPKNGFIALSAAGEFALIGRFEQAIRDLEDGNCYSQSLQNWLFDVTRVDLPNSEPKEIKDWANPSISKNENQRMAVQKALNAPELFLLQGPPGTGKTTVIAEIIYQLVKNGNRVLISSQSNDAVDNALDRLSNNPEVRAIRLGKRGGKKKKNIDSEQCKYVEKEALSHYYKSVSKSISDKYLNRWDKDEADLNQCKKDIRDIGFVIKDLDELNIDISKLKEDCSNSKLNLDEIKSKIEIIKNDSMEKENLRRQFIKFKDFCDTLKPYDVLPAAFDSILSSNLKSIYENANEKGILIPSNFLSSHNFIKKEIKSIIDSLKVSANSSIASKSSNSEIDNLEAKIKLCREEMSKAFENDDYEKGTEKNKELDKLKEARDKLKFSDNEASLNLSNEYFNEAFISLCKSDCLKAKKLLEDIIQNWDIAIKKTFNDINEILKVKNLDELKNLNEEKNAIIGKLKTQKEELSSKKNEYDAKSQNLNRIREIYNLDENENALEIEESIKNRLEKLTSLIESEKNVRSVFGECMKKFSEKLDDEKTYKYDNEYVIKDYINSCNVVGISCTNNMRDLSEKGFDNFDVVIIDEVSKATPPELLIPLMKAGKVILVGDHRQLPPMFKEHEKSYQEMVNDLSDDEDDLREILTEENFKKYENMITASLFKDYFEKASDSIKHSLLTQYRMHSDIMSVINRFYENKLQNGLSSEDEKKAKAHNLTINGIDNSSFISPSKHVYWLDSSFLPSGTPINETYRENSTSATNVLEKYLVIELLKKLEAEYIKLGHTKENPISVGVISFYQRQVNEIRSFVKTLKFQAIDVDVNTVDRFQGKEKNIIITSLVRNNKYARASKHVVTFERINVAFSRAQNLLFIVAAEHMYKNLDITIPKMTGEGELTLPVYSNIIDDLKRKSCFAKSRKLISQELEKEILKEYKAQGGK